MAQYICSVCSYVYDESEGIPDAGIAPGTKWDEIPDDWKCPICGAGKDREALRSLVWSEKVTRKIYVGKQDLCFRRAEIRKCFWNRSGIIRKSTQKQLTLY